MQSATTVVLLHRAVARDTQKFNYYLLQPYNAKAVYISTVKLILDQQIGMPKFKPLRLGNRYGRRDIFCTPPF